MSFRLFVYWCSICGGWGALAGWGLGRLIAGDDSLASAGLKGLCLGMLIALFLGFLDAVWVFALRQVGRIVPRVLVCTAVGSVGGLLGGVVGQLLFEHQNQPAFLLVGWALTGVMVGLSIGMFDLLRCWVRQEDLSGMRRKVLRGLGGGLVGGLLGGVLYQQLFGAWVNLFPGKSNLWSPSGTGFVALGLCIGLWIGVAQVVLKDAWLTVEPGFRKGREMLLARPLLTIGRAETCDIGLFGDAAIARLHARIWRQGDEHLLADAGSETGTYVNDVRLAGPVVLKQGDLIRVGAALLRFQERRRRRG